MDLRTGCAFWLLKNGLLRSYPSLDADLTADVVIIGAGVTGAVAAYELTRAGANVVVVDRRDVASGSTAASTGLLLYETDTSLNQLASEVGLASAVRVYQLGLRAVDHIEELCEAIGDRCGFNRRYGLYLASTGADGGRLMGECQQQNASGFEATWLSADAVSERYELTSHGAIYSNGNGEIDTYRFAHALLARATDGGARVFSRTEVARIVSRDGRVELKTNDGVVLRAKILVQAAGYEIAEQKGMKRYTELHSTFACVSEPVASFDRWEDRCLIWETARPYYYLRTSDDNRVVIGGEDSPFSMRHRRPGVLDKKRDRLMARVHTMFPRIKARPAYAWGGVFAETRDGLPLIGSRAGIDNIWYALGYGANGITFAAVAAGILRDRYLGRNNPDAELFAFNRGRER